LAFLVVISARKKCLRQSDMWNPVVEASVGILTRCVSFILIPAHSNAPNAETRMVSHSASLARNTPG